MGMNQEQAQTFLDQLNQLRNELYNLIPIEQKHLRKEITRAYITINKPDDLKGQIEAVPDGLEIMYDIMHQTALSKKYHFNERQNQIWHQINDLFDKHRKFSLGAVINAWAMFHQALNYKMSNNLTGL